MSYLTKFIGEGNFEITNVGDMLNFRVCKLDPAFIDAKHIGHSIEVHHRHIGHIDGHFGLHRLGKQLVVEQVYYYYTVVGVYQKFCGETAKYEPLKIHLLFSSYHRTVTVATGKALA